MTHTERIAELEAEVLRLRLKLARVTVKPGPDTFAIQVVCGEHMYSAESGADSEVGFFQSIHGPCTEENQRGQIDAHTILNIIADSCRDDGTLAAYEHAATIR